MDATPDNRPVDAEGEARSPFRPPGHTDWACRTDSAELCPESPRLGIIHLLGWMTCVALAFSMWNSIMLMSPHADNNSLLRGMFLIGFGTALGALVIWLHRRYRGLPFPVFPGEYLWLAYGIQSLLSLIVTGILMAIGPNEFGPAGFLLSGTMYLAPLVIFLVAAVKVRVKRWRVLLLVLAAKPLLLFLAGFLFRFGMFAFVVSSNIVIPVLAIVVARDLLQRQRCPWSHWAGVAVLSWMSAASIAQYVCYWLGLY